MLGENGELHLRTMMYCLLTTISEQTIAATEKYRDEVARWGTGWKAYKASGLLPSLAITKLGD